MSPAPLRTVPCPTCGEPSLFAPENKWRPFCSERCKNIDLGAWASEGYRVPDKPAAGDSSADPYDAPPEH
jgi:endogenous inhibitor of DNA gyrase (YacG/DUF329 family)